MSKKGKALGKHCVFFHLLARATVSCLKYFLSPHFRTIAFVRDSDARPTQSV